MEKIAEGFYKRALNLMNSMNKAKKMLSTIPSAMKPPGGVVKPPKPSARISNAEKLKRAGKSWGDI